MLGAQHYYLVGMGGIGVSGVARLLAAQGKTVHGSDLEPSPVTDKLLAEGFAIDFGQGELPPETEVLIYTTAVPSTAPILAAARERGVAVYTYPEALGALTTDKRLIAVTGAHGKSTTTGMLIAAALAVGEDISCLVGTNLRELGGTNARWGKSPWMIVEACEYKRAFLNLAPEIMIVTNLEAEHLDYYKDLADYQSAFVELAGKLPPEGCVVAHAKSGKNLAPVLATAPRVIDADAVTLPSLAVPGEHNRQNAALALATAETLGWDTDKARQGVADFSGSWRRLEYRGELAGAPVYDDYGHHPTEIAATLQAMREKYPERRLVLAYQQHQLDRATRLLPELSRSFSQADLVLIPNIYKVRDESTGQAVTAAELTAAIASGSGVTALYTESFAQTAEYLREQLSGTDVLVVMGAGDIWQLTCQLLGE